MRSRAPIHNEPSQTSAFARIKDEAPVVGAADPLKAVVIGGGTGAPMSIRTLLSLGVDTSAVVAMADDGGSTGILREQADVTPPGDIRKCLAALAADPDDPLTKAFKYRFDFADNHALGNLMLSALEYATGSFPEAIRVCERLLNVRGHVHPSTLNKVTLCGVDGEGRYVEGQSRISHSRCALDRVWLKEGASSQPYVGAVKAICEADLIVLGPGSLYTSIIPNLLVPGVVDAICSSKGKTVFVCPLVDVQGETRGMTAEDTVRALQRHGMQGILDFVLVHSSVQLKPGRSASGLRDGDDDDAGPRPVKVDYDSVMRIRRSGPAVMVRNLADPKQPSWHNPVALRQSFTEVLGYCRSPRM